MAEAAGNTNSTQEQEHLYRSEVDGYGFKRADDFDYESYEEFMSHYLSVLARRARKWEPMLKNSKKVKKSRKVKRYIRKGIPTEHRATVWMTVSGALKLKNNNPGLYQHLLGLPSNPEVEEHIKIDLHRTFPDNIHFSNDAASSKRSSLCNVLTAFAHHRPEVGYCQGLNFIVALMLLVLHNEENCFFLLLVLTADILPDYYVPDMCGLKTDQDVLGELIREKCPAVASHMDKEDVPWSIPTTKWFVCLFLDVLPVETTLRIWDCLFYEGSKILFRVCISLIKRNQEQICAARNISAVVDIFKKVTTQSSNIDCHTFLEHVFEDSQPLKRSAIDRLRGICRQRVQKGL